MSRATLLLLLLAGQSTAADLPPGAVARLGDPRFRAGGPVTHLAVSPDGKRFATAGPVGPGDVVLAVWDSNSGRRLHEHRVNAELFRGLVWGKEGAFALAGRAERVEGREYAKVVADDFQVWDVTDPGAAPPLLPQILGNGKVHVGAPGHDAEYRDFQFSADGSRVAALWASRGKHAVHVFALKPAAAAKLERVGTLDLGAEGAGAVRVSADGRTVVTFRRLVESDSPAGAEFVATVWEADAGTPSKPVRVSTAAGAATRVGAGERIAHRLMLTPDGRGVVTHAAGETAWGFDRADVGAPVKRRELLRLPYGPAADARDRSGAADRGAHCFFPTADALAVTVDRQTVVFDTLSGKTLGRLEGHAGELTAVAVSADGSTVATADRRGLVRLWDAKSFRPRGAPTGHRAPVEHADLSPDGKRVLTWAADETARLWDAATGKELRAFAGAVTRPAFTPDGTAVVFGTAERLVSRDLATALEIPLPGALAGLKPRHATFTPDGKVLLAQSPDGEREAWDWATGEPTAGAKPAAPRIAPQTPSGQMSARALSDGSIQLREVTGGQVRRVLPGHRGRATVLGFTPDGARLLTAGEDHTVLVWDVRLEGVPLPDALKAETNAAKLWSALAGDDARGAYLAMARLAREPAAAVKLAKLRLSPATEGEDEASLPDARAIELLEALGPDGRPLLKELAGGHADAFRTREAKRALERAEK